MSGNFQWVFPYTHKNSININLPKLGYVKDDIWEFQNEYRFLLYATPTPVDENTGDLYYDSTLSFLQRNYPKIDKIFLPLSEYALKNIEITIGPKAEDGTREIIEALCHKYLPHSSKPIIKKSLLKVVFDKSTTAC